MQQRSYAGYVISFSRIFISRRCVHRGNQVPRFPPKFIVALEKMLGQKSLSIIELSILISADLNRASSRAGREVGHLDAHGLCRTTGFNLLSNVAARRLPRLLRGIISVSDPMENRREQARHLGISNEMETVLSAVTPDRL